MMRLSRHARLFKISAAMALITLVLHGCGALSDFDGADESPRAKKPKTLVSTKGQALSPHYPLKGDNDPHPGVARVHRLPIHGIDVSRYQETIDWEAVRQARTRFAFIKATEGADYLDPAFVRNWRGAGAAGIPRAAYHFMYWCRTAEEQASWFIRNVPRDPNGLPPVIDAEWVNNSKTCRKRIAPSEAAAMVQAVSNRLHKHYGKLPIIYTDINFHRDVLEGRAFANSFWLRSTAAEPHQRYKNRPWTFWQWTQTGTVPGIRGEVDRNAFYGTEKEWARFVATGCDPRRESDLTARGYCKTGDPMVARTLPPTFSAPTPMSEAFAPDALASGDLAALIESLE